MIDPARPVGALALVACVLLPAGGCAARGDQAARDTADRFAAAVAGGDPDRACALLAADTVEFVESAGGRGCAEMLSDLDLGGGEPVDVQVWGDAAQVRTTDDVLFLRDGPDGWRVTAAGCAPAGDGPYDCRVRAP